MNPNLQDSNLQKFLVRGNPLQTLCVLTLIFCACIANGNVGQTIEEAIAYYGQPVAVMHSANTSIRIYRKDTAQITETYNEQGICIKSEADIKEPSNPPRQTQHYTQNNYYPSSRYHSANKHAQPSLTQPKKRKTPEETYSVRVKNMWFLKTVKHEKSRREHEAPAGKMYCVLDIEVQNNSSRTFPVVPWSFHVITKDQMAAQGKWCYRGNAFNPQDLPPGTWSKGKVIFEVPRGKNFAKPELDRMTFEYSSSRYINVDLPEDHNSSFLQ